jgi:hypothetical protein
MKKAKIFLTAIVVLAIMSGALAFKAKRTSFLAYTVTGQTIVSFTTFGTIYRTIVPVCSFTGGFITVDGVLGTTFTDMVRTLTGYTTVLGIPVSSTTVAFVCTPTVTFTTDEF